MQFIIWYFFNYFFVLTGHKNLRASGANDVTEKDRTLYVLNDVKQQDRSQWVIVSHAKKCFCSYRRQTIHALCKIGHGGVPHAKKCFCSYRRQTIRELCTCTLCRQDKFMNSVHKIQHVCPCAETILSLFHNKWCIISTYP